MLAIAAPSFDKPSETFIRDHVRTLAPGRTVLLAAKQGGTCLIKDLEGLPILDELNARKPFRSFCEHVVNAFRRHWRAYWDSGLAPEKRLQVVSFLAKHRVQALLAEYGPIGYLFMEACRDAGVPLFVHFHGYDASKLLRSRRHVRNYRELFRAAAGVIAPSRFLADKLAAIGCPFEKLHVVPCGIDPSRFQPSSREPGRILAVGRLVEKKAPHLTIEAFAQIANRYPTARLEIIGDGPLRERCEALIDKFDLRPRVVLHGVQPSDRVGAEMRRASIFVQHSITAPDGDMEGLPVAILEAMASELPIVSTCHSGIPEAVEHGVTGYLVPEGDVNGMAEAMATLLTDPARAAAMGAAGRARVLKYFSLEHACDRLRSIMGLAPVAPPHVYTG